MVTQIITGMESDVRWSGYLDILSLVFRGGSQRVIWRFGIYPGIDAGLESSKVQVPRLGKARIESFPHTSTYLILIT